MTAFPGLDGAHHTGEKPGALLYYSKAAGGWAVLGPPTEGQVLTGDSDQNPSWATHQDAGMTLLEVETASGSGQELDFTAFDSSLYSSYVFVFENVIPASDGVVFYMLMSTNGGATYDTGASDYSWAIESTSGTSNNFNVDTADTQIRIATASGTIGSAANEFGVSGSLTLYAPSASAYTAAQWQVHSTRSDGAFQMDSGIGRRLTTTAVNAVRFIFSSASNIESGTIRMYGLKAAV